MVSYSMGGQSAQSGLPATSVIGSLDPGDDRDPELFSGPPPLAVQDVLLQQREERFHRGVDAPIAVTSRSHRFEGSS